MARQRKAKNELDAILEQLKRSYGSESSDMLEDELLESSDSEEDIELNEILGKIFSSEEFDSSESGSVAPDENGSSENAANSFIDQELYHEFVNEAEPVDEKEDSIVDDNENVSTEVPSDGNPIEKDTAAEDESLAEELDELSVSEIDEPILISEENTESIAQIVEENNAKEAIGNIDETSDTAENERAVEDVLNIMFSNKTREAIIESLASDDTSDIGEDIAKTDASKGSDEIEEFADFEDTDDAEEYEDIDESGEYESFDYIDREDDPVVSEDEETFAVEDEEYDVDDLSGDDSSYLGSVENDADDFIADNEPVIESEPIPSPKLVLNAEDYTNDPLQSTLARLGAIENKMIENRDPAGHDDRKIAHSDNKAEAFDKNDISMLLNLGYGNEIKSKVGEKKAKEVLLEKDSKFNAADYEKPFGFCGKELTDRSQLPDIKNKYRYNCKISIITLSALSLISFLIMVVDLIFEFNPDRIASYPALLTIEMTLVLATAVILYKKLISGVIGIFKFEIKPSSVYSFVTLMYGIFSLVSIVVYFFTYNTIDSSNLMLFGFCVSLYAVLSMVSDLLICIKEYNTFKIIELSNELYVAERQNAFLPRNGRLRFKVNEDRVYKIRKTSLVNGYFGKTARRDQSSIKPIYLIGVVPIIALVIGGICFFFGKSLIATVSVTMFTAMLCLPIGYVCMPGIVEYITSKWVSDKKIAFIGDGAAEEMSKTELIILKDTDTIEIMSYTEIQPTHRTDIKESLDIAYELFKKLGGPLAGIGNSVSSDSNKPSRDIVVNQVSENGIDIYFDSSISILFGDKQYMQSHNIKVKTDGKLSTAVRGVDRSVMYMAFDGVPKLGFIVNSRIKSKFIRTVNALWEDGVRVFVETYEPQINKLYYEQNKGDCPASIGVIKPEIYEDSDSIPICDGCIISGSDALNLANAINASKDIHKQKSLCKIINLVLSVCGVAGACTLAALMITGGENIAVFKFLSEHMTVLFALFMGSGLIPGIVEIIRISKKKK